MWLTRTWQIGLEWRKVVGIELVEMVAGIACMLAQSAFMVMLRVLCKFLKKMSAAATCLCM